MRAAELAPWRLDGTTVPAGCLPCPLLSPCGGYTRVLGAWSCMPCDTCRHTNCDKVCLARPGVWMRTLIEIGDPAASDIPPLLGVPEPHTLPRYVPLLLHEKSRSAPLDHSWVAVPLHLVVKLLRTSASGLDVDAFRRALCVAPSTRIVVVGTGLDAGIENYWGRRKEERLPDRIARLGIHAAVAPDYSFFLDDPRPNHLANRKRSLVCAAEWARRGLPPIPYVQALSPADWRFWERFLSDHAEVNVVAKEFATGLSNPARGREALDRLADLQESLGRPLHVVAVSGFAFARDLRERFSTWTVIDATPFMKAMKRQAPFHWGGQLRWRPARGEPVADLLATAIDARTLEVEQRAATTAGAVAPARRPAPRIREDTGQLLLL